MPLALFPTLKPLFLNSSIFLKSTRSIISSFSRILILSNSWLVLKPSKKLTIGRLDFNDDKYETIVKSDTLCTELDAIIANPVGLVA